MAVAARSRATEHAQRSAARVTCRRSPSCSPSSSRFRPSKPAAKVAPATSARCASTSRRCCARAAPTRSIVEPAPRSDGSAGRVRVRALGHAAPGDQRARRHRARERRLVARSVDAARRERPALRPRLAPTPRARSPPPSSRSSATQPRDLGVLFSGDEEAGSAIMHAFLDVAARARDPRGDRVRADRAHRRHRASRRARAAPRRSTAPAATRRRPTHMPKPIVDARAPRGRARRRSRRAGSHDGPAGMTGTVPQRRGARTAASRSTSCRSAASSSGRCGPYPGFDRAALGSRASRARAAIDPAIAIATTIDHAPFACARALAELVRPFVRSIGPLDFWTEAALYDGARHRRDRDRPGRHRAGARAPTSSSRSRISTGRSSSTARSCLDTRAPS